MVNKTLITISFIILSFLHQSAKSQVCQYLVWSDEFNGVGAPVSEKWGFETGAGGWGNNELQNYTSSRENSYVGNGVLTIHAKKFGNQWTSARMVTAGKASWKYGRLDIRAKLPAGRGTWPAIWMMPAKSVYGGWPKSGEIDIMEHVGYNMGVVHGSIHSESFNHIIGTQKSGSINLSNVDSKFYTYSVEWTPQSIKWFVDGSLFYTFNNLNLSYKEWPFDQDFFLILNIAIGGNWGGAQGIDPNLTEAKMEIDYVRVYSNQIPKPAILGPSSVKNNSEVVFSVNQVSNVSYNWEFPLGVEIVDGLNTNIVKVKWGNSSGIVKCTLSSECESVSSNLFSVKTIENPQGEFYRIPIQSSTGELLWKSSSTSGNSLELSSPGPEALKLDYNITSPTKNPFISIILPNYLDFSVFNQISLKIKIVSQTGPNLMRIDLVDKNGNINSTDIFRITDPVNNKHYNIYNYTFTHSQSDSWLLEEISEVRVYLNYGVTGKKGSGSIIIADVMMGPANSFNNFSVAPVSGLPVPISNEFSNQWSVHNANANQISLLHTNGNLKVNFTNLSEISNNEYFSYSFPKPVDITKTTQLNLDLSKDINWPSDIKIELFDINGKSNGNDVFSIQTFYEDINPPLYKYVFGNKGDGGDFLICRVSNIRFSLNKKSSVLPSGIFNINSLNFIVPEINNSVFESKYSNLNFYPNPASNYIKVIMPVAFDQIDVKIFSLSGVLVHNEIISDSNGLLKLPHNLRPGIYIIKAGTGGKIFSNKLKINK